MNTQDETSGALEQLVTASRQTSLNGRVSEQRALDRLRSQAVEGSARSPKISSQDLKAMRDEQRLEKVFNQEVTRRVTKHESFKKDLAKAKKQTKTNVLAKRTRKALAAVSVPAVFAVAAATMIVCFMSEIKSQAYASQAKSCIARGENEKAYAYLKQSLLWNPYNISASFEAGRLDERRKDRDEAYSHFERAVKLDPNNVELLDRKGSLALKLNKYSDAAETYTHLLKVSKNARKKLHHFGNRAVAFSRLGEYEKAIDDYTSVIKMKRNDQDSLLGRAFCHSQINEYNAAISDLNRVLDINPSHYEALLLKGWAHQALTSYDDAQADFEQAIAAQPKNEKGYIYLAHMFRAAGNSDAALAQLDKVVALNPSHREAHVVKGQILLALGLHKEALNEFQTVDNLKSEENYFSLLDRARAALGANENKQAIASYNKLIALKPELCELYFERAQAEANVGDNKQAIKDIDQAVKLYPHYTQAMLKRAECNLKLGNEVSAVADFHNAIESTPFDAKPYIAFGKFNLSKQQFVTAKECFDKAVKLDAANKTAKELSLVANNSLKKLVGSQPLNFDVNALSKLQVAEIEAADFNGLLDKGYQAIKAGKMNYAEAALERAVRLDPNSKVARRYLATAFLVGAKGNEAEAQINVLNSMGAGQDTDSLKLAAAYRKAGNCQKAIAHLERHIASHPSDVNSMLDLSDSYAALGNIDKAADVCLVAMKKSNGGSNYARLNERYLSLKESQDRALMQQQQKAGNNATVDTQG